MKKLFLFLGFLFFPFVSFGANGSCTFPGHTGQEYRCYTYQYNPVYYSFSGSANTEYYSPHRLVPSSGASGYYISVQTQINLGTFTVFWNDAITPGPQGNTGATGSQGIQGNTGSVDIQGTVNNLNITTNISYSGVVIRGFFDNYKASYDLPSWNVVLHLNAPADTLDVQDLTITGTGLQIFSAIPIDDISDPRIVFNIRRITEGDTILPGWYGINVPSSWLQGKYGALPNVSDIGFAFQLTDSQSSPLVVVTDSGATFTGSGFIFGGINSNGEFIFTEEGYKAIALLAISIPMILIILFGIIKWLSNMLDLNFSRRR